MEIIFQDYYGQFCKLHNNTASGNLRFIVKTMKDLNALRDNKAEECDLETDISLNKNQAKILHAALGELIDKMDEY